MVPQKIALIIAIVSVLLVNCTKETIPEPELNANLESITFEHSMKGWELYSWPNGNDWNYSILTGTNRLKTVEEVKQNNVIVTGVNSLKMLLDKFPENEAIYWMGEEWLGQIWQDDHGNLSLPDKYTLIEIKNYCNKKGLLLTISD